MWPFRSPDPLQLEISLILEKMGHIFYDFGLVSDTFSILAGRYQLPIAPAGKAMLVSGWLKIPIRTELMPKGVFLEDLDNPRLITALKSVLGRNIETRSAPLNPISGLLFEGPSKGQRDAIGQYEFWYFVEMDKKMLRSIPRWVDFSSIPPAPSGRLPVFFGVGVAGSPLWYDFPEHVIGMLVAGATRSGKSVFLRSLLTQLAQRYPPSYFSGFLADFKFGVEFGQFSKFPHFSLYDDPVVFLSSIRSEMARRYDLIKSAGFLNILQYNDSGQNFLPYSLAVIDEVTMFKLKSPKGAMDDLIALVAQSAGSGIYWILSTQRPSVDIVSGSLKANLGARGSSSQATQVDYDVVFGEMVIQQPGPLGNPGRFWWLIGDNLFECQSPFID